MFQSSYRSSKSLQRGSKEPLKILKQNSKQNIKLEAFIQHLNDNLLLLVKVGADFFDIQNNSVFNLQQGGKRAENKLICVIILILFCSKIFLKFIMVSEKNQAFQPNCYYWYENWKPVSNSSSPFLFVTVHTYTHTHTYIHIYMYLFFHLQSIC